MNETKEIVVSESVQLGTVQASSPQNVIERAETVATPLADLINRKRLYTVIGNKKYVQVDGWATLGAMLGVLPRETKSQKVENGYEAYVELVRTTDGMVIGGASAICTRDERNWSNRDEYALKSMATTRATGKAYRLAFSWIMNLAGYESTPAEEMIDVDFQEVKVKPQPKPIEQPKRTWAQAQIDALMTAYNDKITHAKHAEAMLNLSAMTAETPVEKVLAWAKVYRDARDNGKMDTGDAAKVADKEILAG